MADSLKTGVLRDLLVSLYNFLLYLFGRQTGWDGWEENLK